MSLLVKKAVHCFLISSIFIQSFAPSLYASQVEARIELIPVHTERPHTIDSPSSLTFATNPLETYPPHILILPSPPPSDDLKTGNALSPSPGSHRSGSSTIPLFSPVSNRSSDFRVSPSFASLETPSAERNLASAPFSLSIAVRGREDTEQNATKFLKSMEWTAQDLNEQGISIPALTELLTVETSRLKSSFRWASMDRWLARVFHYPLLDFGGLGHSLEGSKLHSDKTAWSRFWMYGRSLPLKSAWTLHKALSADAFREGLEWGTANGLKFTFLALLGYQLFNPTSDIINIYRAADTNSTLALANEFHKHPSLFAVFVFPFVYGLGKGLFALRSLGDSVGKVVKDKKQIIQATPSGIWPDYFRWALPFHPINSSLRVLEHRLLWEGRHDKCSLSEREEAFALIEQVARQSKGLTQTQGFYGLSRLAYGLHLQDIPLLTGAQDQATLLHMLFLKTRAFQGLHEAVPHSRLAALYRNYYLWSLGYSPSFWKVSMPMATLKGARLAVQAFSLVALIKTILQYLNCPEKPGLSFTGYQPWSSSYSQDCFDELVRQFNVIPGQPANTLVDALPQYYFPTGVYALDLSDKGIEADVLVEIIKGFQQKGPTLTALNLGGNNLGTKEALTKVLSVLHPAIKKLGLSAINTYQTTNWEFALAQSLPLVPFLTALDLSYNSIGLTGDQGTVAIGQSLGNLTALTSLNLSNNRIGLTGDQGTVAIGQSLGKLSSLTECDLSINVIGVTADQGVVALSQGLTKLKALNILNLAYNYIGRNGALGIKALGTALRDLSSLTWLSLFHNPITSGTVYLAQGLHNQTDLLYLDLSYTGIGFDGQGIPELATALSLMHSLRSFFILPSYINPAAAQAFNNALASNPHIPPIPMPISTPEDVSGFFKTIPQTATSINLSKIVRDDPATIRAVMQQLALYPSLLTLDLSYNTFGYFNSLGTITLGKEFPTLRSLRSLDLSWNIIGLTDSIGEIAVGEGLSNLTSLTSLNFYNNYIGYRDSRGTVTIGDSLKFLPSLTALNFSRCFIGYTDDKGTEAIGQSLGFLPSLMSLDFFWNRIGFTNDQGTLAIGQSLRNTQSLRNLILRNNWVGYTADNGTVALAEAIALQKTLKVLDLSANQIGLNGDKGTMTLGRSFSSLNTLEMLDLSINPIGTKGSEGTSTILSVLPDLTKLEIIRLGGMQNVSWTEGAAAIASFTNKKLQAVCESQLCHGTPIKSTVQQTGSTRQTSKFITSSASRLEAPWPFRWLNRSIKALEDMIAYSFDSLVSTMTTALKEVTDDSPSYFPNIENPNISDWQTNPLQSANQKIGYGMLTVPSQPMITNTMIFNLSLGK